MRPPRPRIGLRGLMAAVAVAAALLGWRQHRLYERLRVGYEQEAVVAGMMWEISLSRANFTHEEWLEQCRWVDAKNAEEPGERSGSRRFWYGRPDPPEVERRRTEYYGRLKAKYERAARRPWASIEPDGPPPR